MKKKIISLAIILLGALYLSSCNNDYWLNSIEKEGRLNNKELSINSELDDVCLEWDDDYDLYAIFVTRGNKREHYYFDQKHTIVRYSQDYETVYETQEGYLFIIIHLEVVE